MINTYNITTCMGKLITVSSIKLNFLNKTELKELDSIGYTGKTTDGDRINRKDYLNSLNKGRFEINQTKYDSGDFIEEFTIIRVTK